MLPFAQPSFRLLPRLRSWLVVFLGFSLLAGAAPGAGQNQNSDPAGPKPSAAEESLPANEADETLVKSRDRLTSTNLLMPGLKEHQALTLRSARERLELARQQRQNRLFSECRAHLTGLLETEAPEEIWRAAMLELALLAQDQGDPSQAQQVYSQYISKWPLDGNIPEVLLRQGLLYREMGLSQMAVSKFYAVMTSALVVKGDRLEHYQRLVLQAQVEIAETYYLAGKFAPARDSLTRLLKQESPNLNRARLQVKLVRCLAELKAWEELVVRGQELLNRYPEAPEEPEVRFLIASACKELGRKDDSLRQVQLLLQLSTNSPNAGILAYWKRRAGNDIANQLYQEGDFFKALDVYVTLASLDSKPDWQCPVQYQVGLIYERLEQPVKAAETYQKILNREKEIGPDSPPSLRAVLDLARWRSKFLGWQVKAEEAHRFLNDTPDDPTTTTKPQS